MATATLVGLCLLSGLVGTIGVAQRADLLNSVALRDAPLIEQTFTVYRSLADADATSADAFLANANESSSVRSTFENDIATAASALTNASALSATLSESDVPVTQRLDLLSSDLTVYTGLIETARTYNRQGLPLGASYLSQASNVLRTDMLPQARSLYDEESAMVAASEGQAAEFPWLTLVLVILLVGALVVVQVGLRRHTRRSFNVGLLAATLAVVGGGIWLVVAASIEHAAVDAGRTEDTTRTQVLADALTDAQQARTDEALMLIARGAGAQFDDDFTTQTRHLDTALNDVAHSAPQPAIAAKTNDARSVLAGWLRTHGTIRDDGDTADAVSYVLVAGPGKSGPLSTRSTNSLASTIDIDLSQAVDLARTDSDDRIHRAREALAGTEVGFAVLIGLALISTAAGMQPRLAEYR